jgi:hypothetical protein
MPSKYAIKTAEGAIINYIVAEESFVIKHYEFFEKCPVELDDLVISEKEWRDKELKETDWIVPVIDHPQHSEYLVYRQALRDWPSTPDFPDTRPTLGI